MKDLRQTEIINKRTSRLCILYVSSAVLMILALACGLLLGSVRLSVSDVLSSLFGGNEADVAARIIRYVRLPRTIGGILCGAALATSGAVIQGVLSNRLASPSIIGVNSGAALAVTLCAALGVASALGVALSAFVGAFLAVVIVSIGAYRWGASKGNVILMGVALNALLGAISDTITVFCPDVAVHSLDFKMGDLSGVTYQRLVGASVMIGTGLVLAFFLRCELDVLTLGEDNARGIGVNTSTIRVVLLLVAALLASAAVMLAGLLSFVGLLVPHAVRRLSRDSRHILPLCTLVGGGFVSLCDTLARTVFSPYELPVGIIMAFLGAPFFIFILIKGKGGRSNA